MIDFLNNSKSDPSLLTNLVNKCTKKSIYHDPYRNICLRCPFKSSL